MNRPLLRPDLTPLRGSRDFRATFTSRTVAMLGSQAAEVALLVQARQLTGSPLVVGLLGMAELVPLLVFGLYGGVLADRLDRRALMRWCEPGLACCAGLLLLNALLPRPALWPLFVVAALLMAISSLQRPSFEAATPRLVPREQITTAVALLSIAPSAGGLLVSATSGWMSGVRRHGLAIALSAATWGAAIAGFGLSPDIYAALVCLIIAGGADECSGIFRDTLWFQTIPDRLRGRMGGVELLSYGGGPPLGQLRSGAMASAFGQRFSLVSGGLACIAAVGTVCATLPAFTRHVASATANENVPTPAETA